MKASFSWLKEYVPIEMPATDLADALTMAGLEVEALTDRYDYLDTVMVGRVTSVAPHPNADKLTICLVDIGDRIVSVVCGAPNVEEGMLSALALPGTVFPDGVMLEKSTIRGQASEGMLCSEGELGLGIDRSGIMVLDQGLQVGEKLGIALSLSDPVLEIDLTPNRPDCLSILGIAREIAAIQDRRITYPDIRLPDSKEDIKDYTSVTIDAPDHCPRYAARLLNGIKVMPSPFWLQDRLMSVGLRPINNIVDVTNFVMMETGQPLHAFDFEQLEEHRIVVRTAQAGETFITLDEKERVLSDDTLMICDGKKPVAVGGVMGGLNSEIEETTQNVLIEGAYFSPPSIRRTAKRLGLGTDASHRFERGVDPEGTLTAINRAAQLMAETGGGTLIAGFIDEHPIKSSQKKLQLSVEDTNRFLGIRLSKEEMQHLLESIEFEVQSTDDDTLSVVAPFFRVDIKRPVDLMEEVARLSGYNAIPTTFPSISAGTKLPYRELALRERIKVLMGGLGFMEAINYSFMNKIWCDYLSLPDGDPRRRMVEILNPLTEDQTVMRTSIIPGILVTMHRNISQQIRNLKLFEIGKIFIHTRPEELPEEKEMLVGLWTGDRSPSNWAVKETQCDFYDIKGAVESLIRALKADGVRYTRMSADDCHFLRHGYAADICIGDDQIGSVGEIHSDILRQFDLKQPAFMFEIDVHKLSGHVPDIYETKPISKFPATSRDITIIVDEDVETGRLLEEVNGLKEKLIENINIFDVYKGDPIPDGRKSISFRIRYRSLEETLQDEAINNIHKDITDRLVKAFNAALPS